MSDTQAAERNSSPAPAQNGSAGAAKSSVPRLDIQKLHALPSEQQDLYLFTFAVDLEEHVSSLDLEDLSAQQIQLNEEIFKIIDLQSPALSKAIRNSLGRSFARILGQGNRKTLFDTINHLNAIVNAAKGENELHNKHAAVHCLGEVYRAAGDSALNLSALACSSLIRLIKPTKEHTGLRAAIFTALNKIVTGIGRPIDEAIARDIWKQCRKIVGDEKGALVQARICLCVEALVKCTTYYDTTSGFEDLRLIVWKASESHVPSTRHAAAACLAAFFVKSYAPDSAVRAPAKPKKKKAASSQDPEDAVENGIAETSRPMSPPAGGKKAAEKLVMSLSDILRHLSAKYTFPTTSNRVRISAVHCYCKVLQALGPPVVEGSTFKIMDHLLTEFLSNSFITHDRHKLLLTRKLVQRIIVNCMGTKIFGESGRLNMARSLISNVLKNYPQVVREIPQPSKHTLVGALDAVASLIQSIGSAFRPLADSCREALLQILQHPSYTVQIYAANCLRALVETCPQQLLSCASICMNSVVRELGVLASGTGGKLAHRRCMGYANALAAVISVFPTQPLYGSLEISSKVLNIATDLLKSSSQADLQVADTQVQVSWILIGGLMALGPNFVKIHLSQFLLLWKNSLPKPLKKDNTKPRHLTEIHYLTSIRECTLGSIYLFLEFNTRLLTNDVSRRIAVMLQNTIEYMDSLAASKSLDDDAPGSISSLSIQDLILMVRRRVFQCFCKLIIVSPHVSAEVLSQSNLLTLAVTLLADPDSYAPGSLSTSIANASGSFDSIWDVGDNSGFGITGLVHADSTVSDFGEYQRASLSRPPTEEALIDEELSSPVLGGREHDAMFLHIVQTDPHMLPDPPATEVVNGAISLFAVAYPLQTAKVQESILEQIAILITSPSLQRDPGRRAAVTINAAMAIYATLKTMIGENQVDKGDLRTPIAEKTFKDLLKSLLLSQDNVIRRLAYESVGRLCNCAGNAFTSSEVDNLIDTIVSNRDPHARAGCSMALGAIHSQVGGMAAGLHMKKIYGVLMSLCGDPNPTVHLSAVKALSQVADSAGLAFLGNVPSTLGLLAQLWTSDSHNEQSSSPNASNLELEAPASVAIAHCLDSLINVLGPDIQDMAKVRGLMLTLMRQFELDTNAEVQAECLKGWDHLSLYDSPHVELGDYVERLQRSIDSSDIFVKNAAVDGLYNLVRRDAALVFSIGQQRLEEQVWSILNAEPDHEGMRNIIHSWLSQTGLQEPEKWIRRCQQVLTKISQDSADLPVPEPKSTVQELPDEEVAGFNVSESKDQSPGALAEAAQELLRWQVRAFALQCLNDLVANIGKDAEADPDSAAAQVLQDRLSDIIRLAFLSSTASVTELQVGGLQLIDQILKIFGSTPDPDFSEALLLEQYQAQISSALTPAFAADSSPDLASAAVNVCATFLAAGLVTDVDRMGRILKLLITALEGLADDTSRSSIGDLKGLSSNAQTMVRLSVLSAWADLQVASTRQEYLVKVVKPFVRKLAPLWLSSLQDFARLRFEPDISSTTGPARPDEGLDVVYAALNRQTLLKFYQDSWLKLVEAIASLIDQDSEFVFDALDGKDASEDTKQAPRNAHDINYRDEPAAFFFVLFGIVIEALTTRPGGDTARLQSQTLGILSALKRILKPSIAGTAIFQDAVFSETMELFDRLALTEDLDVQLVIVDVARQLCLMHPSAREGEQSEEHLSEDIEQLFELTRIIVLVLAGLLPNLAEQNPSARAQLPDEGIIVIQSSLEALVDAADVFPTIIKSDLHASILHIFGVILGTGSCQANAVPQALPVLKRFLQRMTSSKISESTLDLIRSTLYRFTVILAHAQRRETESSLPCAKNTLLAITILITTASRALHPNDSLVIDAVDAIRDCLQDRGLSNVAANCLRTLVIVSPKTETDEAVAKYLLPHLIHFTVDTESQDPENARLITTQALTSFVSISPLEGAPAAMCIVIPVLLTRAAAEGKDVYPETAKRLFELAGGQLTPIFKGVVNKMSAEQKAFMEKVIREGGGAALQRGRGTIDEGKEEPTIALKMNFA